MSGRPVIPLFLSLAIVGGCPLVSSIAFAQSTSPSGLVITPDIDQQRDAAPSSGNWSVLQVGYEAGLLTVFADNSTLADTLAAIREETGAEIEIPERMRSERIVVKAGPASAGEVLAQILNGSGFDYIIMGSAENSLRLQKIVLLPRNLPVKRQDETPVVAAVAPPPSPEPQAYGVAFSVDPADESAAEQVPVPEPLPDVDGGPQERIPGEVLDQMQKLRIQQRQQMQQQMQQQQPPPESPPLVQ